MIDFSDFVVGKQLAIDENLKTNEQIKSLKVRLRNLHETELRSLVDNSKIKKNRIDHSKSKLVDNLKCNSISKY